MTNEEILQIAMEQSAIDCNCDPQDFRRIQNVVSLSAPNVLARRYLSLPFSCNLVSYGNNIVASVQEPLAETVRKYIDTYPTEHCFETPNLHVLSDALQPHGLKICFMAEYFLPDVTQLRALPCNYELRLLHAADFADL